MKFKITVFLSFLLTILVCRNVHAQANSLYVRVSKSLVQPGESYILYVLQDKATATGYTGLLDVQATVCPASNPTNCTTTTGPWGDYYINNGSAIIDLPSDMGVGIYKARFKPRDSSWAWSNEIQVNVNTTYSLENTPNYWVMFNSPVSFKGVNNVYQKGFTTVIGFLPQGNICGEQGQTMYFMKDIREGYWDPYVPWYSWRPGENNLLWHLVFWQKKSSWHDEYLTAWGDERFKYNPANPFDFGANFQTKTGQYRYDSANPQFPGYLLSPRWLGNGWGLGYNEAFNTMADPAIPLCQIKTDPTRPKGAWIIHADLTTLNLPRYNGPALRLKFYEGEPGFVTDRQKLVLREDWYFVKNVGLAKIDQKYFGPNYTGPYASRKPCLDDPDCLINEFMSKPHVTLTRAEYLPTPTATPTPTLTPIPTPTPSFSFSLSSGWNQITWPDISGYTAFSTLADIDSDCGAGTAVAMARKRKDWWEGYAKNYGGSNFGLQNNQNYFINITKSCTWTP